jgi:hypothetical protein
MPNLQNGVYDNSPWIAPPEAAYPPQAYLGPFASNRDRVIGQALASATMPGEQLQELVRPPLPQIELFPPRFGYEVSELSLEEILQVTSRTYERTDYAQQPNTQESTSRNTLGWGV